MFKDFLQESSKINEVAISKEIHKFLVKEIKDFLYDYSPYDIEKTYPTNPDIDDILGNVIQQMCDSLDTINF